MRIVVYPADLYGCGYYRLVWAAEHLRAQGHDVALIAPQDRDMGLRVDPDTDRVTEVTWPHHVQPPDVVVHQRLTHPWMAQSVAVMRRQGIASVVDVDDRLDCVHPRNPAYAFMHPSNEAKQQAGPRKLHSWNYLAQACRDATLVTVSTPGLLPVYAAHGRGRVLENAVPQRYLDVPHTDSDVIGWPAALHTHPDDPGAVGGALARLVADGAQVRAVGDATGLGAAFGLPRDPAVIGDRDVPLPRWPEAVSRLGIGIAPLADTAFNACKSWLKPLELAAVGVPVVMTPSPEYTRLHRLGVGVLAGNGRRWYRELDNLRRNTDARLSLGEAGRAAVADLTVERQAWRWLEAWTDAYESERGRSKLTPLDRSAGKAVSGSSRTSSTERPSGATV